MFLDANQLTLCIESLIPLTYSYFEKQIEERFTVLETLVGSERKLVQKVRHDASGGLFVLRRQQGSCEIYRKLLEVKSRYMPEIFETAEEAGRFLVLEEFIRGDSVSGMLRGALFTEKETRGIAMDVCRALYVLHGLNIVHRDVKPENIILRDDRAVLLDFDASRETRNGEEKDTVVLGTVGYAAPEQYGIAQTDGRADIYALGVTMNVMLTGEHPSVRMAEGRMGRVISRCVQVDSGRRYADVRHLMEALA